MSQKKHNLAGLPPKSVPPAGGTILDPTQTSSLPQCCAVDQRYPSYDVNPDYIPFEHRGWHPTRMRVYEAMMAEEVAPARCCKFLACGEEVHVYQNGETGEIAWRGQRCNDRFCIVCGQIRSRRIANALERLVGKAQPLFITFTVRGKPGDSLADLISQLNEGWKGLRRLDYWKDRIRGGAMMLEVKWSATSGGHWHPHYHMICHGKWIDQQWLRDAWKVLTRGSFEVKVERVKELDKAIGYVVKYASKPMDGSFTSRPHLLREAMRTLKGRRLCSCFGSWFGTPLHEDDHEEDDATAILTNWSYCGTRRNIESRAAAGDATAKYLLERLVRAIAVRHSGLERCRGPDANSPTTDSGSPGDAGFDCPF